MSFLQEFYAGDIFPCESIKDTKRAKKALITFSEKEEILRSNLSEESVNILNELFDAQNIILTESCFENFKCGFRLGVQMMCECLKDD